MSPDRQETPLISTERCSPIERAAARVAYPRRTGELFDQWAVDVQISQPPGYRVRDLRARDVDNPTFMQPVAHLIQLGCRHRPMPEYLKHDAAPPMLRSSGPERH